MSLQYVERLLREEWHSSITGRYHDVGELDTDIKIVEQGDDEWRAMSLENYDYLTLMDGGDVDIAPQSIGWTEQETVSRVDIDIRTRGDPEAGRPGKIALYGERGAGDGLGDGLGDEPLGDDELGGLGGLDDAPRWGGLVGEVHRCIKSRRKGDEEYDIIDAFVVDDVTDQMGGQIWRALVNVRLEERAEVINTTP